MNKLHALISLLDDPNEEIYSTVEGELLKQDVSIVPELEKVWETTGDLYLQKRLEDLIHNIQFKDVKESFRAWLNSPDDNLLYGSFLVSKYQYPELKYEEIFDVIDRIRKEIWLELNNNMTALEKVKILNHILFDIHGFARNNSNFMAPQNSYIRDVFDTRKGNPVSLSIIYSVIAQNLGLPIYGVNLPKNFILAYIDDTEGLPVSEREAEVSVFFYINPINRGAVLSRKEIEFFIRQQKLEPRLSYFLPCNNYDIILRMLNNLLFSYESLENKLKTKEIKELMSLFPGIPAF